MALSTLLIALGAVAFAGAAQPSGRPASHWWIQSLAAHPKPARAGASAAWLAGAGLAIAARGWTIGLSLAVATSMAALVLAALALPLLAAPPRGRRSGSPS